MTTHKIAYNFTAMLSLFPTSEGGRKKAVYSHYRPSFSFGTKDHFSGEIILLHVDELAPGSSASAMVKLLPSRHIRETLKGGDTFTLFEGEKLIGMGVIQKIEDERRIA